MNFTKPEIELIQFLDIKYNPRKTHHNIWHGPLDAKQYFRLIISKCTDNEKEMLEEIHSRIPLTFYKKYQYLFKGDKRFNRGNNLYVKQSLKKLEANYHCIRDYLQENYDNLNMPMTLHELKANYRVAKNIVSTFPHRAKELSDL